METIFIYIFFCEYVKFCVFRGNVEFVCDEKKIYFLPPSCFVYLLRFYMSVFTVVLDSVVLYSFIQCSAIFYSAVTVNPCIVLPSPGNREYMVSNLSNRPGVAGAVLQTPLSLIN